MAVPSPEFSSASQLDFFVGNQIEFLTLGCNRLGVDGRWAQVTHFFAQPQKTFLLHLRSPRD